MQKDIILSLETATESCSVALSSGNELICEKYINSPKVHACVLAPFVDQILKDNNLILDDCCAIAVSEGPGSYTGLRVGVSTAKGLCYGLNKPLLAVSTLATIAQCTIDNMSEDLKPLYIIPMIDARRMEVYSAVFNSIGEQISETEAKILDENSYSDLLSKGKVIFTGNGSMKFQTFLNEKMSTSKLGNAIFCEQMPHASGMRVKAAQAYYKKEFKDCAYFEPFYLKEFVAGTPKKLL